MENNFLTNFLAVDYEVFLIVLNGNQCVWYYEREYFFSG